jgi:diaminopimelate decarboxylase
MSSTESHVTRRISTLPDVEMLEDIASRIGTPFWLYDAAVLRHRIKNVKEMTAGDGLQARFAMKSCPATRVLKEMKAQGIWIDAVSGNECLRALRAGYTEGNDPPQVLFTADVFRDNGLDVIREHNLMPNIGSPGMLRDLDRIGYRGPIALRVNPGFGHGHVNSCDTGGPSSKHGIWFSSAEETAREAEKLGMHLTLLHAHVGSGPQIEELLSNLRRLAREFATVLPRFKNLTAVSLGGGIPHHYKDADSQVNPGPIAEMLAEAHQIVSEAAGKSLRLEIEPGRYFVAPCATLVSRVADIKRTETNAKGHGQTFIMVDAGFVDLIRPAMYGSYHRISIAGKSGASQVSPFVVAGPLCESGDVFTRDAEELLAPRDLPSPKPGDLLLLHDGGAYGYAMSSNYNSIGRAPQVWLEEDGTRTLISRRETLDDILKAETEEPL